MLKMFSTMCTTHLSAILYDMFSFPFICMHRLHDWIWWHGRLAMWSLIQQYFLYHAPSQISVVVLMLFMNIRYTVVFFCISNSCNEQQLYNTNYLLEWPFSSLAQSLHVIFYINTWTWTANDMLCVHRGIYISLCHWSVEISFAFLYMAGMKIKKLISYYYTKR